MWISKKKYKELEKRVADLEQNQSQQNLNIKDSIHKAFNASISIDGLKIK